MLIRLGGLFLVVALIFWLWAIFDSITSDAERVRNLPKLAWVIVVIIGVEIGAAAWLLLGRPRGARGDGFGRAHGMPGPRTGGRGPGPVGPDDDPDFLKGI